VTTLYKNDDIIIDEKDNYRGGRRKDTMEYRSCTN